MKTIATTILFIMMWLCGTAQTKETVYYDFEGNKVTKPEFFNKRNYDINIDAYVKTDSIVIAKLVPRKNYSKLSRTELSQLRKYLWKRSGKKIDSTKTIVINYLSQTPTQPYVGKKSQWTIFSKRYLRKLEKMGNIHQIWINNPDNQLLDYFHDDRIDWVEDSNRIIESVFFPFEFEFGNFVVIDPDGNYISYFAEYGPDDVYEFIEEIGRD